MNKFYKNKKGLTLVELLVAIGIFGIIMIITGSMLNYSSKFYVKSNEKLKDAGESRIAMSYVINKLRANEEMGEYLDTGSTPAEIKRIGLVKLEKLEPLGTENKYGAITFYSKSDGKTPLATIKMDGDKLVEVQYNTMGTPTTESTIAYVSSFSVKKILKDKSKPDEWNKKDIEITIGYIDSSGVEQKLSTILNRKCELRDK